MDFIKNIWLVLQKPFPVLEDNATYIKNILGISLFVVFFLYVFRPFDMSNVESGYFLMCVTFGAITFGSSMLYDLVFGLNMFSRGDNSNTFTYGKWIVHMLGIIMTISVFNFLYIRIHFFGYVNWIFFPYMLLNVLTIGIFPVTAIGAISVFRKERKYQDIANEINTSPQKASRSKAEPYPKLVRDVVIADILYVESLQNYVKIGYRDRSKELIKVKTERATLKQLQSELENSTVVKCHRSYLVNREAIGSFTGNAQGLVLHLKESDKEIPVSRSFVSLFRN